MMQPVLFVAEVYDVESQKKKKKSIRSPLFYVGDKYKLMPQLKKLFPNDIDTYYDVFCGGGSASINVNAKKIVMNDVDEKIIELHEHLQIASKDIDYFIEKMYNLIKKYGLSLSEKGTTTEIEELKKIYIKTNVEIFPWDIVDFVDYSQNVVSIRDYKVIRDYAKPQIMPKYKKHTNRQE